MATCIRYSYSAPNPDDSSQMMDVYERTEIPAVNCGASDSNEYILQDFNEYQAVASNAIMYQLFDPEFFEQGEYQTLFVTFFSLPLIVYLVAWAYQSVINFATKD